MLFADLVAGGVQVVQNRGMFPDVRGPLGPGAPIGWRRENVLHFDHRKFMVVDGRIGWLGGTGIEDHFNDERFTDVMVRFEGPAVRQLQALFVAGWRHQEGPLDADEASWPPSSRRTTGRGRPGGCPATLLVNVPGTGHVPISEAYEQVIDAAERRVDLVNPYISERPILDRLVAAAQRGVAVRIIVPGKPTPPMPAAAFRHNVPRLQAAGATVLFHPTMAHAKVMVADDRVLVGGCNLDALSFYRNWELNLLLEGGGGRVVRARDLRPARRGVRARGARAIPGTPGVRRAHGPDLAAALRTGAGRPGARAPGRATSGGGPRRAEAAAAVHGGRRPAGPASGRGRAPGGGVRAPLLPEQPLSRGARSG